MCALFTGCLYPVFTPAPLNTTAECLLNFNIFKDLFIFLHFYIVQDLFFFYIFLFFSVYSLFCFCFSFYVFNFLFTVFCFHCLRLVCIFPFNTLTWLFWWFTFFIIIHIPCISCVDPPHNSPLQRQPLCPPIVCFQFCL